MAATWRADQGAQANYAVLPTSTNLDAPGPARQCRICLSEDDPGDLIAPCRCAGSARWVHRDCLDSWRANVDRESAFSRCPVCLADYKLIARRHPDDAWKRKAKYRALVARDFFLVFVVTQLIIVVLGAIIRAIDNSLERCYDFCPVPNSESEPCEPCAPIRHMFFPKKIADGDFEKTYIYTCGLVMFLAIIGILGTCNSTCFPMFDLPPPPVQRAPSLRTGQARRQRHAHVDCCICRCDDNVYVSSPNCDCCVSCNASNCPQSGGGGGGGGNNNDCEGFIVFIVMMVVLIILAFAVVGIFYGIVLISILGQRIAQRHLHYLELRVMTADWIVADLSDPRQVREADQLDHRVRAAMEELVEPTAPPAAAMQRECEP